MKPLLNLLCLGCLLAMTTGVQTALGDDLDDLLGPVPASEQAAIAEAVAADAASTEEIPWTPSAPYVLPEILPPVLAPALKDLPLPPGLTPIQFTQLRAVLTRAIEQETVLTPLGLVVLCPPVLKDPLKSLERWLRILDAAGITFLPTYERGTPAEVMWRQLSANPQTTEAEWVGFYKRLKT
ncbi:hypothetical protein [Geminisphaera colitermitum]|uniref:hypothetical protein n=1 Tax=Geminisphaera colitermitum TaxID=1148786 RepID=UPI0001965471|nr:hypothetical protein [Geminisphaera colitermitum]